MQHIKAADPLNKVIIKYEGIFFYNQTCCTVMSCLRPSSFLARNNVTCITGLSIHSKVSWKASRLHSSPSVVMLEYDVFRLKSRSQNNQPGCWCAAPLHSVKLDISVCGNFHVCRFELLEMWKCSLCRYFVSMYNAINSVFVWYFRKIRWKFLHGENFNFYSGWNLFYMCMVYISG